MKNVRKSYWGPEENIDRSTCYHDGYHIMAMLKDGSGPYSIGVTGPVGPPETWWAPVTTRKEGSAEGLSPSDLDID